MKKNVKTKDVPSQETPPRKVRVPQDLWRTIQVISHELDLKGGATTIMLAGVRLLLFGVEPSWLADARKVLRVREAAREGLRIG